MRNTGFTDYYTLELFVKMAAADDKETIGTFTYRQNLYNMHSACAAICRHTLVIFYSTIM
jgi:hypothetical protein